MKGGGLNGDVGKGFQGMGTGREFAAGYGLGKI
jgi:hypothetical protein